MQVWWSITAVKLGLFCTGRVEFEGKVTVDRTGILGEDIDQGAWDGQ